VKSIYLAIFFSLMGWGAGTVQAQTTAVETGYLCCNMRSDGSWISDSNYQESGKTIVPLGTPVTLTGFGRYRVNVQIKGQAQTLGNDYSRDVAMEVFAKRYIVQEDPRAKLAAATPKARTAMESARVTKGMSREQVLMALGYPIASENPHLDGRVWKYWLWTFSPFRVHFDANGMVTGVSGDSDTLAHVYLE
jgi:SmpA / OmlA family